MNRGRSMLGGFALAVAVLFFVATIFQLVDQLNLVHQPPQIPDSANLVDRVSALIPFRHDEWPIFFIANLLVGLGFLGLVGLAMALAARAPRSDDRRHVLLGALAVAGILGAIGQLVLIGASKAAIDIPYCDCGFKDQEIVSQVWAEMVAGGAVQWLLYGAQILAAAGLVAAGAVFGGRGMPDGWTWLSDLTALALVVVVVLGFIDAGDATTWLTALVTAILVPAWSLWLRRALPIGSGGASGTAAADA